MTDAAKKPLSQRRAEMEARLAELRTRLHVIETELDSHHAQDWEDLAVEREGDEVLEAAGLSGQAEIRAIEAALSRIGSGEYGACARCGADIAEARLDLLPWTPLCPACAGAGRVAGGQKGVTL